MVDRDGFFFYINLFISININGFMDVARANELYYVEFEQGEKQMGNSHEKELDSLV